MACSQWTVLAPALACCGIWGYGCGTKAEPKCDSANDATSAEPGGSAVDATTARPHEDAGTCTSVGASDYDQSCAADRDCTRVAEFSDCAVALGTHRQVYCSCMTGLINADAATQY